MKKQKIEETLRNDVRNNDELNEALNDLLTEAKESRLLARESRQPRRLSKDELMDKYYD